MGHYDSCYEAEEREASSRESKNAKQQLKLMEKFLTSLIQNTGTRGISRRHLDHFEDMLNETRLRSK